MERFVNEVRQFSQMRPKSYTCPMCGKNHRFPTEMDYFYSKKDRYGNLELWKGYHWFETRCEKTGSKVKWLFHFDKEGVAIKCKINGIDFVMYGESTTKENELIVYLKNQYNCQKEIRPIHNEMFVEHQYLESEESNNYILIPLMVRFEPIQVEKSKLYWNRTGNQPNVDFTNIEDMLAVAKRQDVTDDILRQVVSKVLELRAKEGNSATETEEILLMIIENPNVSEETANIIINSTQLTDLEFVILKGEKVSEKILHKLFITEIPPFWSRISYSNLDKIFRNSRVSDEVCLQCLELIKKEYVSNHSENTVNNIYPYLGLIREFGKSLFEIRAHLMLPLFVEEWVKIIKDAKDGYKYRPSECYEFIDFLVKSVDIIALLLSSPAISSEGLIEIIDNIAEVEFIVSKIRFDFVSNYSLPHEIFPLGCSFFKSMLINKNCTSEVLLKFLKHQANRDMEYPEKVSCIKMIAEHPNANRRVIRELAKKAIKLIDTMNHEDIGWGADDSVTMVADLINDILIFLRDPRILEKDLSKILEGISKDELSQMLIQGLLEEDTEEE